MNTTWIRIVQITVPPEDAALAIDGHRVALDAWRREGRLVASWELAEGGGFVDVFRAVDRLDATAAAAATPLVEDGLCAWTLRAVADGAAGSD